MRSAAILAAVLALAACADDGEVCPSPLVELRNPNTLSCTPLKTPTAACPDITLPPWPVCRHECERLRSATSCAAAPGCHVAYKDCVTFPDQCTTPDGFVGCYGVVTIEPPVGPCSTLTDAVTCSSREDCAPFYNIGPTCPGGDLPLFIPDGESCRYMFDRCVDELAPPP